MVTFEDCMGLSGLTEQEIQAIAEHEHLPEIIALEFGDYLVRSDNGIPAIKKILLEDIEDAECRGDLKHALELKSVLRQFVQSYPEAVAN